MTVHGKQIGDRRLRPKKRNTAYCNSYPKLKGKESRYPPDRRKGQPVIGTIENCIPEESPPPDRKAYHNLPVIVSS